MNAENPIQFGLVLKESEGNIVCQTSIRFLNIFLNVQVNLCAEIKVSISIHRMVGSTESLESLNVNLLKNTNELFFVCL